MSIVSQETQVAEAFERILNERARVLARETGWVQRERKFTGATLVQSMVFAWQQHPDASLEQIASTAATADVVVSDTAIHKHFTQQGAETLRQVLEEMTAVVIQATEAVDVALLKAFDAVILEDSSTISLPQELAQVWQGSGNQYVQEAARLKLHVRWELQRGRLDGPALTDGRVSDQQSPWAQVAVETRALYVQDLGYFSVDRMEHRQQAGAYTLTRLRTRTSLFDRQGHPLSLRQIAPKQVGQSKEVAVLVGTPRVPMRLLLLKVPPAVAQERRERLQSEAKRHGQAISEETLALADWTILLTDAERKHLSLGQACVLLRERWQIELLFKLWKQEGQVDEWRTANPWRVLCEVYAKLIGLIIQHWMIVLYAWHDLQRSLVKLAQVCRDTCWTILEALAGHRTMLSALQSIARKMRAGCQMNKRKQRPNSAQLLKDGIDWALHAP